MIRTIRIISQVIFFLAFTLLLFVFTTEQFTKKFPSELFLQINPLVALLTSIASREIIGVALPGAISVMILTILFGRFFCGFVCPLGAVIDFSDKFLTGKARATARRPHIYIHRLKYVLLIALIILSLMGIVVPLFFDPISLLTRIMAVVIDPALRYLGMTGKNGVQTIVAIFSEESSVIAANAVVMTGSFSVLLLFGIIIGGGFWDRRFWCQYVCPTGAFLGLLGIFPLFRRIVDKKKCNNCRACASRQCPTRAISHDTIQTTTASECIVCGICSQNKHQCTSFRFAPLNKEEVSRPDIRRRHIMAGILGGLLTPALLKGNGKDLTGAVPPVRPPGAIPEDEFLTRCIACGECIKVCPSHCLAPCGFTYGFIRLSTPKLTPLQGYCEAKCNACTLVCPTIALRPVTPADKPYIKMGTAVIDQNRCLAWNGEIRCMICKNKCPYNAITEQELEYNENYRSGPIVEKDLCTGCGICERYCAFTGNPAIKVYSYGERRISSGPFVSERKKERILKLRENNKKSQ